MCPISYLVEIAMMLVDLLLWRLRFFTDTDCSAGINYIIFDNIRLYPAIFNSAVCTAVVKEVVAYYLQQSSNNVLLFFLCCIQSFQLTHWCLASQIMGQQFPLDLWENFRHYWVKFTVANSFSGLIKRNVPPLVICVLLKQDNTFALRGKAFISCNFLDKIDVSPVFVLRLLR